jgi:hypothetical protein
MFESIRPPLSSVGALLLTLLVLLGFILSVADFRILRFEIITPAWAGSPLVVHRGQSFVVEGIADDGGNVYRPVNGAVLHLIEMNPSLPGGESYRTSAWCPVERSTRKFAGKLKVAEGETKPNLYVRVELYGDFFSIGTKSRPLRGNLLKVRVE